MTQSPDKPNIISRDTPLETARLFHAQRHENMVRYQNDWLDYDGSAYVLIEDKTVESEVLGFLDKAKRRVEYEVTDDEGNVSIKFRLDPFNPKDADVQNVVKVLCHDYLVNDGAMVPPFFLEYDIAYDGLDPANLISCKNGLLDITTRTLYAPTPLFFTRTALPIDYDPDATCPQWLTFMLQVLADDGLIMLMQQWFGYLITTDVSYEKFLYLRGVPRSGKGTTARVLDQLVGPRNVTSHTIRDLAGTFGREGLIGKSLLKFTDMNTDNKQHLSEAASTVNCITGEDPIHIERKFKGPLDVNLAMHVVMIGNQFPDFGDHTAAIGERLSAIPFLKSFASIMDPLLTKKLLTELPGILNWAIDGLQSLREMGKFVTVEASENAKRQILNSGNPVRGFVNDLCDVGPDFEASKDDLFSNYTGYCISARANTVSRNVFFTKLKTAVTSLQLEEQRTGSDGDRERIIVGIRLRNAGPPTTITKEFWLDEKLVVEFELGLIEALDDAILLDPITGSAVEAIENEFPGWSE